MAGVAGPSDTGPRIGSGTLRSIARRSEALSAVLGLLRDLVRELDENGDEARLIALELRCLLAVREGFLKLLGADASAEGPAEKGEPGDDDPEPMSPADAARLMRAWDDSVARVLQLLRERRALREEGRRGSLDRLLDEALAELERLPGLSPPGTLSDGEEAPDVRGL